MLKAAVIGAGSMGGNHARVYMDLEDVELVAVADPSEAAGRTIQRRFGVRPYLDYRRMLDEERPDLVTIAVPTAFHKSVALDVASAGVHMLVEKPLAGSSIDAREIVRAAERHGVKLAVGHIERFNPAVIAMKQHLEAGDLGTVFEIHARRLSPFPARLTDVGVVLDLAPHELDVMSYLFDTPVESIYAQIQQRIHPTHEDAALGVLRFANGVVGVLDLNWLSPIKLRELTVTGARGMYQINYLTQDLYYYENSYCDTGTSWDALATLAGVREGNMTKFALERKEPLRAELESFIAAVRNGTAPAVGAREGLAAVRLSELLLTAGRLNKVVDLSLVSLLEEQAA